MVPADSVLVKRVVTGVNASDVNFTSGKYQGSAAAAEAQLPFTAGFESVGVICRAGTASGGQPPPCSIVALVSWFVPGRE